MGYKSLILLAIFATGGQVALTKRNNSNVFVALDIKVWQDMLRLYQQKNSETHLKIKYIDDHSNANEKVTRLKSIRESFDAAVLNHEFDGNKSERNSATLGEENKGDNSHNNGMQNNIKITVDNADGSRLKNYISALSDHDLVMVADNIEYEEDDLTNATESIALDLSADSNLIREVITTNKEVKEYEELAFVENDLQEAQGNYEVKGKTKNAIDGKILFHNNSNNQSNADYNDLELHDTDTSTNQRIRAVLLKSSVPKIESDSTSLDEDDEPSPGVLAVYNGSGLILKQKKPSEDKVNANNVKPILMFLKSYNYPTAESSTGSRKRPQLTTTTQKSKVSYEEEVQMILSEMGIDDANRVEERETETESTKPKRSKKLNKKAKVDQHSKKRNRTKKDKTGSREHNELNTKNCRGARKNILLPKFF